jgi:hypothetical protein
MVRNTRHQLEQKEGNFRLLHLFLIIKIGKLGSLQGILAKLDGDDSLKGPLTQVPS